MEPISVSESFSSSGTTSRTLADFFTVTSKGAKTINDNHNKHQRNVCNQDQDNSLIESSDKLGQESLKTTSYEDFLLSLNVSAAACTPKVSISDKVLSDDQQTMQSTDCAAKTCESTVEKLLYTDTNSYTGTLDSFFSVKSSKKICDVCADVSRESKCDGESRKQCEISSNSNHPSVKRKENHHDHYNKQNSTGLADNTKPACQQEYKSTAFVNKTSQNEEIVNAPLSVDADCRTRTLASFFSIRSTVNSQKVTVSSTRTLKDSTGDGRQTGEVEEPSKHNSLVQTTSSQEVAGVLPAKQAGNDDIVGYKSKMCKNVHNEKRNSEFLPTACNEAPLSEETKESEKSQILEKTLVTAVRSNCRRSKRRKREASPVHSNEVKVLNNQKSLDCLYNVNKSLNNQAKNNDEACDGKNKRKKRKRQYSEERTAAAVCNVLLPNSKEEKNEVQLLADPLLTVKCRRNKSKRLGREALVSDNEATVLNDQKKQSFEYQTNVNVSMNDAKICESRKNRKRRSEKRKLECSTVEHNEKPCNESCSGQSLVSDSLFAVRSTDHQHRGKRKKISTSSKFDKMNKGQQVLSNVTQTKEHFLRSRNKQLTNVQKGAISNNIESDGESSLLKAMNVQQKKGDARSRRKRKKERLLSLTESSGDDCVTVVNTDNKVEKSSDEVIVIPTAERQSPRKLASIFCKDSKDSSLKHKVTQEVTAAQKQFLKCSTADDWLNLKSKSAHSSNIESFTKIAHVQQLTETELKAYYEKELSLAMRSDVIPVCTPVTRTLGYRTTCPVVSKKQEAGIVNGMSKKEIKSRLTLLKELVPSYPVEKLYKKLRLRNGSQGTQVDNELWTDKYKPLSSMEVLGNTDQLKIAKEWLSSWLDVLNAKKIQAPSQGANDDSESGSEYADQPAPVLVITGPHGVGKTACVYALANELDCKVFEMNSSAVRSSKSIMVQLRETIQSHQVNRVGKGISIDTVFSRLEQELQKKAPVESVKEKKTKGITSFFTRVKELKPEQSEKPVPTESNNYKHKFRSRRANIVDTAHPSIEQMVTDEITENANNMNKPTCKEKRKRRRTVIGIPSVASDSSTESSKCNPVEHIKLSSTSVILFDEVDVVFEEDKGFWQAIRTLSGHARKPIIVTATSANFVNALDVPCLTIKMCPPPRVHIETYLSVICLVEAISVNAADISAAVEACGGDLRRSIHQMQFLVAKGSCLKLAQTQKFDELSSYECFSSVISDSNKIDCKSLENDPMCLKSVAQLSRLYSKADILSLTLPDHTMCGRNDITVQAGVEDTTAAEMSFYYSNDVARLYLDKLYKYSTSVTPKSANRKRIEVANNIRELVESMELFSPLSTTPGREIYLDYIPCMEVICSTEHSRMVGKTQRRFFHYLDKVMIHISDDAKLAANYLWERLTSHSTKSTID